MILVDAHVHIYDCFDLHTFLDSALSNFRAEAARCGQGVTFTALLLLTETARENWFQRLKKLASEERQIGNRAFENWTFHRTKESSSLCARRDSTQMLFLIAGRQIVTAENLEVLALATDKEFEDGIPLTEVIRTVRGSGAIPVIPWGPGKWMGQRGMILTKTLNGPEAPGLFLGDNGNRPGFWPRPSHFKVAETKGIRVLPGSDPLPFPSESWRPGSFGFSVNRSITPEYPASDLKRILLDPTTRLKEYGHLEHLWRFFRNQLTAWIMKQRHKQQRIQDAHW